MGVSEEEKKQKGAERTSEENKDEKTSKFAGGKTHILWAEWIPGR